MESLEAYVEWDSLTFTVWFQDTLQLKYHYAVEKILKSEPKHFLVSFLFHINQTLSQSELSAICQKLFFRLTCL